jgi:ATP-dependent exoDNAse (exonuclease V) alpha subunit
MAIYHLSVGHVSRSSGRSAVQSAAYITGSTLYESRRDLKVSYQNRQHDITCTQTLVPDHAPATFRDVSIWDRFESFEDTYAQARYKSEATRQVYMNSARTAMTLVVALPRELPLDVAQELVEHFARERFVSRGLVVTYALHEDEGNPHAHLQISRRAVLENGDIAWVKDRDICTRSALRETRKLWADLANRYLEREGFSERITAKSFADMGVELFPTRHRGWYSDKLKAEKGFESRIVLENQAIEEANRENLLETPSLILNELTHTKATFTQRDLLKAIQRRVGDDHQRVSLVFEQALGEALSLGEGLMGETRYTSASYLQREEEALAHLDTLSIQSYAQNTSCIEGCVVEALRVQTQKTATDSGSFTYSPEQIQAMKVLTQDTQISTLIGRAGAGKTSVLRVVARAYEADGKTVMGTSPSALAAQNLAQEAQITSKTLHSWLYRWNALERVEKEFLSFDSILSEGPLKQLDWYQDMKRYGPFKLTPDHVVMVDEAGMVGTSQWKELLHHISRSGAKLIAVGDDHQFKAIEAGDFFRALKEKTQEQGRSACLETIHRQRHPWMQKASRDLADLKVQEALSTYEHKGCIHGGLEADIIDDIATAYVHHTLSGQKGLVLAYAHEEVNALNGAIRERLMQEGRINARTAFTLKDQDYALGDRIVFLRNDRVHVRLTTQEGEVLPKEAIYNGTTGTLIACRPLNEEGNRQLTVDLENGTFAQFSTGDYDAFSHGYALTLHKSQGQTVDFTLVKASRAMDAKALYVALTRHREDVQLYYEKKDFRSFKNLAAHFSRFEAKDLVKDYTIRPENEEAWQRVQEYRLCGLDASATLKEAHLENKPVDWESYNQIKKDQIALGKEILANPHKHTHYLSQAGLTAEDIAITCGLQKRPLSLAEEKAKLTVELYGERALHTRLLWNTIRRTHPGSLCYQHPLYASFQEHRQERDSLAHVIQEHYPLHRPFVNERRKTYGINQRTVEAQAQKFEAWNRAQYHGDRQPRGEIISAEDRTKLHAYGYDRDFAPERGRSNKQVSHFVRGRAQMEETQPRGDKSTPSHPSNTPALSVSAIRKMAKEHGMESMAREDHELFIAYVAQETYQAMKEWSTICGLKIKESTLKEKAALTGVYTALAHAFLSTDRDEKNPLDKALAIGPMAAQLKMEEGIHANAHTLFNEAIKLYRQQEREASSSVSARAQEYPDLGRQALQALNKAERQCQRLINRDLSPAVRQELGHAIQKVTVEGVHDRNLSTALITAYREKKRIIPRAFIPSPLL